MGSLLLLQELALAGLLLFCLQEPEDEEEEEEGEGKETEEEEERE